MYQLKRQHASINKDVPGAPIATICCPKRCCETTALLCSFCMYIPPCLVYKGPTSPASLCSPPFLSYIQMKRAKLDHASAGHCHLNPTGSSMNLNATTSVGFCQPQERQVVGCLLQAKLYRCKTDSHFRLRPYLA